jgi:hypothetical protein
LCCIKTTNLVHYQVNAALLSSCTRTLSLSPFSRSGVRDPNGSVIYSKASTVRSHHVLAGHQALKGPFGAQQPLRVHADQNIQPLTFVVAYVARLCALSVPHCLHPPEMSRELMPLYIIVASFV